MVFHVGEYMPGNHGASGLAGMSLSDVTFVFFYVEISLSDVSRCLVLGILEVDMASGFRFP